MGTLGKSKLQRLVPDPFWSDPPATCVCCSAETYQLAAIAFCLVTALATTRLGVSPELGAFIAGVMVGSTDQQESMLHHLGGWHWVIESPLEAAPRGWVTRGGRAGLVK